MKINDKSGYLRIILKENITQERIMLRWEEKLYNQETIEPGDDGTAGKRSSHHAIGINKHSTILGRRASSCTIYDFVHQVAARRKIYQRPHGKRKLKRKYHL